MTPPTPVTFAEPDLDAIAGFEGRVAVIIPSEGKLDAAARRVNRLTKGALARLLESDGWSKAKPGDVTTLNS